MNIEFAKMHGAGNDFVVIDAVSDKSLTARVRERAAFLADRRFGVGCDQVLLAVPAADFPEVPGAELGMRIFNADGSEVEMCGNGIRCLARFAVSRGLAKGPEIKVATPAGLITPRIEGDLVAVDMGRPILDGPRIPINLEGEVKDHSHSFAGRGFRIHGVSMGNPHCVIFVDDTEEAPVTTLGPVIEKDPLFPKRINVEFVQVLNRRELKMRVWERGSGETLACGTGACATMVAAVRAGLAEEEATVHLRGGDLRVRWPGRIESSVIMTGPAAEVFTGRIDL